MGNNGSSPRLSNRLSLLAAALLMAGTAMAQDTAYQVDIAPQALDQALNALAGQTGSRILFATDIAEGRQAQALKASLTVEQALQRLVSGSGLRVQKTADGSFLVSRPQTSGALELNETSIIGRGTGEATEGTGSYTTNAVTIGKTPQSLRETPQSVTVVTRTQMDDKNLNTLDQVLAQTTGMTRANRNFGNHRFSARGFDLHDESYMIDSVPGQAYSLIGEFKPDLAIFDRVEILRGAAGLLVGAGNPGGAVNLVRKRPTVEPRFSVTARAGSWDNYRLDLDGSGKLNESGSVRGRLVTSYEDRGYFSDLSSARTPLFYGIVEADVTDATTLTLGLRQQTRETEGYTVYGLPSYSDGSNPHLKRSTSLAQDWNRHTTRTTEVFADMDHRFNDNWSSKVSVSHSKNSYDQQLAYVSGTINPATNSGPVLDTAMFHKLNMTAKGIDAHLDGKFEAFGLTHQVTLGANWSEQTYTDKEDDISLDQPFDVFNPNHHQVAKPGRTDWDYISDSTDKRYGTYLNTRLHMTEDLSLVLGGRLSWYDLVTNDKLDATITKTRQDKEFTPFAGVIYDLNPYWSWYASYADIFRPQSNYRSVNGSVLDPAIGSNYETGIKGELFDKQLNVSFAVFYIKQEDVAVEDYGNSGKCVGFRNRCYTNSSLLRSKGFETEASGELFPGMQVAAGYTYNTTRNDSGSSISSATPKHMLRLSSSYNLQGDWSRLTVGGGVSAQNGYEDKNNLASNSGRAIFDARASYKLDKNWTVAIDVENLLDRTYFEATGNPSRGYAYGEPRSYVATLRGVWD